MDIYKKNIEALGKNHEHLVALMESTVVDEEKIKVLHADSGVPRILYKKEDGEEVYIHNAEDPADCANQAIDLLGSMDNEGIITLFGFGLGYLCEELLERIEQGHILMIYEATVELFKTALMTRDISALLESNKVNIVLGPDADNFTIFHRYHQLIANGKFWVVAHKPSIKLNEKAYDRFLKRLKEEKKLTESGVVTVVNLGKEFINTFLANIPFIIRKPGVNKLKDVFKGRPVIIVSAGPSLDRNLHLLEKAKGKAIIIAVDAVIPTLLPCGIIPDMIVGIDPLKNNIHMFKDNPLLKEVPFVCLAQYTPEIVRMYPGPMFFNSVPQNIAYKWLSYFWDDKGYIDCIGGSVAHLAFGVAEFIGSDVIAFVGQDLSFNKAVHSKGFKDIIDVLEKKSIRDGTDEVRDQTIGSVPALNIFDEDVSSRGDFMSFKTSFENRIKIFDGTVINATEGGLPIDGAAPMRLADFIDQYCSDLTELDTFSILTELTDDKVGYNLEGLITEITAAKDKFNEIKKNSGRILKYIKRLEALKGKGQKDSLEFHKIIDKVEIIIEQVKHPSLDLIAGYHYGLELYLKRQDIQNIDDIDDKWEKLDKQLDRGAHYYSEVINAIVLFNKQLVRLITALKREELVNSVLSDTSIQTVERCINVGMIYKKAKMTAPAVKYFNAVSEQRSMVSNEEGEGRSQEALILLAEMYTEQFRFYEAKDVLINELGQRDKYEKKITALLKTCNGKINRWEVKKLKMGKLFKDAESGYGSDLESGYFYFRVKGFKRAEKAYLNAIEKGQEKELTPAYYGLAHTYLALFDQEKAVSALEKAIEIDPDNPIFYRDLGYIAISNNNVDSAELFFKKALELAPEAADLYKTLADIYIGHGEREKAIALYEEALEINSDNPVFQKELVLLYNEVITKTGRC